MGILVEHCQFAEDYYDKSKKGEEGVVYALGSLMFKMLFGFVPYEGKYKPKDLRFSKYI